MSSFLRPLAVGVLLCGAGIGARADDRPPAVDGGPHREWVFVGTVLDLGVGLPGPRSYVRVGPDPQFHLQVLLEAWEGPRGPFAEGSIVDFAIHSPSRLLASVEATTREATTVVGKSYRFRMAGRIDPAGARVADLTAETTLGLPSLDPPVVGLGHVPVLDEELPITTPSAVKLLTGSARLESSYEVIERGIHYQVAVDASRRVSYIAVGERGFLTPEGLGLGAKASAAFAVAVRGPRLEPGWAYVVELPSGWNAAFDPGERPSTALSPSARVRWFFRRR